MRQRKRLGKLGYKKPCKFSNGISHPVVVMSYPHIEGICGLFVHAKFSLDGYGISAIYFAGFGVAEEYEREASVINIETNDCRKDDYQGLKELILVDTRVKHMLELCCMVLVLEEELYGILIKCELVSKEKIARELEIFGFTAAQILSRPDLGASLQTDLDVPGEVVDNMSLLTQTSMADAEFFGPWIRYILSFKRKPKARKRKPAKVARETNNVVHLESTATVPIVKVDATTLWNTNESGACQLL